MVKKRARRERKNKGENWIDTRCRPALIGHRRPRLGAWEAWEQCSACVEDSLRPVQHLCTGEEKENKGNRVCPRRKLLPRVNSEDCTVNAELAAWQAHYIRPAGNQFGNRMGQLICSEPQGASAAERWGLTLGQAFGVLCLAFAVWRLAFSLKTEQADK